MAGPTSNVTGLLLRWNQGVEEAREQLIPLVYSELRKLAARSLRGERAGHTLQPTALVHEAYQKLIDQRSVEWQNRAHFYGVAAGLMRRILVDHARRRNARRRGGGAEKVPDVEDAAGAVGPRDVDLVALDHALLELASFDPQQARIVELRYFGGLSLEETAEAAGISRATVHREWTLARAWLRQRLTG
jgi:RNA polymerase sigma factor (TIGR02999 family)